MSLSLKAELETWAAALKAYDEQDFQKALDLFSRIADSSKILTNMGLIYATIGEHETAVEHFVSATNLDAYLAIAHFQCGVSNFLLQRYDFALLNFEDAYLYLRGNEAINYDQLGLKFKLFSAEILFNKGLAQINLGYADDGIADMQHASRLKVTDEHGVIDEAIRDLGQGYTVFSIPVGILYRPSENKLKNSKTKDYLGKAKLVAATDSTDAFTEFTGVVKLQQAATDNKIDEAKADTEPLVLSRSATVPPPRTNPISPRPTALERSKTSLQGRVGIRPDPAAILASRKAQSVSNPVDVPPLPSTSDMSMSNTRVRSNTTRLPGGATNNTGVMPLRTKTSLSSVGGVVGIGTDASRAGGETGAMTGGAPTTRRPSLRRPKGQGVPPLPQSVSQPPQALQPGQYMNTTQNVMPLMLPAVPAPPQEGHLTQFYNAYMDVYTDDHTARSAIPRPATAQAQHSTPSPPRQSPSAASFYQQPQPQEQQQLPAWMQSASSPVRSSSNTSNSPGMSRAPSRATNASAMNANSHTAMSMATEPIHQHTGLVMVKGGINNATGPTPRRKTTRRPAARRVTLYEDEDGDDGFVTGDYDEFEMANIRVKLHYQGDVRGMAVPSTTSFNEFVERVTAKFGTSLTGLGMKFADEDGTKISLRDESDFELAIETARESAKGRSEGKIEVWCVDV